MLYCAKQAIQHMSVSWISLFTLSFPGAPPDLDFSGCPGVFTGGWFFRGTRYFVPRPGVFNRVQRDRVGLSGGRARHEEFFAQSSEKIKPNRHRYKNIRKM